VRSALAPRSFALAFLGLTVVAAGAYYATRGRLNVPQPPAATFATQDGWAGRTAPEFALQSLANRTVHLSDFRGKVTLINFWATWCAPCRVEMPYLVGLRDKYRDRGFEIVGVSVDDNDRAKVEKFARDMHVGYPIVLKDATVGDAYGGVRYLPQSFLLDRDGRVLAHIVGMLAKDDYEAQIVRALHRPSGA